MHEQNEGRNPLDPPVEKQEEPVPAMTVSVNRSMFDHSEKYIDEHKSIHYVVASQMEMSEVEIIPVETKAMDS